MNQKLKNEELGRLSKEAFKNIAKNPLIVVLDNVRSLNNVGSVFRTCDAFLIDHLYLCGVTGTPPNNEIEKTALGATDTVSWKYFKTTKEAIDHLKKENYKVYSVEQAEKSVKLHEFKNSEGKIALIFGNEVYGVEQDMIDLSDGVIEIPQLGTKHSLNISVSAGIVIWDLIKQRV